MQEKPCCYLFVYGTLLDPANQHAAYLHENARLYAKGKIKGKLYDIGNYPGAVPTTDSGDCIYGSIFEMADTRSVLEELDEYEGYGDQFAQPNEFIREKVDALTKKGIVTCWVYYYNHTTAGKKRIISGRYQ